VHRILPLITISLLLILFSACRQEAPLQEQVEAIHLKYDIHYMEDMAGDVPTRILPRTMDAYYTRSKVYTEIDGFLGQFNLVQVADLRRKQVTTLLNFFGNRVYYEGSSGELPAAVHELPGLTYRDTGDTLRIGGLLSHRMEVHTDHESYDIYYTRDFHARRPNISTPYQKVNHPLTDFRVGLSRLKMHLSCKSNSVEHVDYETFLVPDSYKEVDRAAMEEIINSLFTKE
jgi:hypothetical protein